MYLFQFCIQLIPVLQGNHFENTISGKKIVSKGKTVLNSLGMLLIVFMLKLEIPITAEFIVFVCLFPILIKACAIKFYLVLIFLRKHQK